MVIDDLPTPSLLLDRGVLVRNIARMAARLASCGVPLRPHMKTAKSIDVARLALAGQPGGITVSTLAEAEYFAAHGITDILYAVGITPRKLEQIEALNAAGADMIVVTDDSDTAAAIAARPRATRTLVEIDTGEHRAGLLPGDERLPALAARLGPAFAGVMTHGGNSYAGRSHADMAAFAEAERAGLVHAADRLRSLGQACPIVSMGSTPTALHAASFDGVTEVRAGVYMFGDLFQAGIGSNVSDDIAITVLASVIGRGARQLLIDAGALALSKDRSTHALPADQGFGVIVGPDMEPMGAAVVTRAYQEHGVVEGCATDLPVGALVRVLPNHACLTAAAYDRYYVTDGGREIIDVWTRVNGW